DPSPSSFLGASIVQHGDCILAGATAWPHNTSRGKVYLFERVGSTWHEVQTMTASDAAPGQEFGRSIAWIDDRIFVGAGLAPSLVTSACGALYVFEQNGPLWLETEKITAPVPTNQAEFGWQLARSLDNVFVAACSEASGSANYVGAVYAYDLNGAS